MLGKKVIVLLDEYDKYVSNLNRLTDDARKEMTNFHTSFITSSFRHVPEIERCVVAGVMITQSELRFDECNLLSDLKLCRNFGFNNGDIVDFARELSIKKKDMELAKNWYNGNSDFIWNLEVLNNLIY
jgi:hypothetical protein